MSEIEISYRRLLQPFFPFIFLFRFGPLLGHLNHHIKDQGAGLAGVSAWEPGSWDAERGVRKYELCNVQYAKPEWRRCMSDVPRGGLICEIRTYLTGTCTCTLHIQVQVSQLSTVHYEHCNNVPRFGDRSHGTIAVGRGTVQGVFRTLEQR